MSYQFIHIEAYARVGSNQKGKSEKWNIHQIAGEAMRNDEDCTMGKPNGHETARLFVPIEHRGANRQAKGSD